MLKGIRRSSILVLALAVGACAPAAPVPDTAADQAAIDAVRSAWQDAYNAADAAGLAALYASDAVVMPPYAPAVAGPAAIQARLEEQMAQATTTFTVAGTETIISGDWAVDRGTYQARSTPMMDGAESMIENGKYLVVLQRQADGSWKIAREISNVDAPPPGMAMPGMSEDDAMDGM